MKKFEKYIEEEVAKTLQAFDGLERARPKPFLYTRLRGRLERKSGKPGEVSVLSPAFQRLAIILVILIVAINIYTVTRFFINPGPVNSAINSEQLFVEEYYPSMPTLYNISQPFTNQ
jgi:hypothetical protein